MCFFKKKKNENKLEQYGNEVADYMISKFHLYPEGLSRAEIWVLSLEALVSVEKKHKEKFNQDQINEVMRIANSRLKINP
ncbi:MAG TPA: hypothetical protein GX708_14825 [Gallicola sp.]|nr:hypothetical protein [Gallicola sp.]